ncbi:MAG TPA: DUF3667 domain-containing protein, partial [Gemmatimonadaceae bacterium]|nr:DUF3667 domain-containing protein [Gemmatimonadaceae bacterium]
WDGKVLGTLRELMTRPGQLTVDFLAGRRARWLPPFRLYLIASIAYFVSVPAAEFITHRKPTAITKVTLPDSLLTPVGDSVGRDRRLKPEVAAQLDDSPLGRVLPAARIERVLNQRQELDHAIRAAMPKMMFVLLPVFALLLRVAWRDRFRSYVPHLYFSIHVHAFTFMALLLRVVLGLLGSKRVDQFASLVFVVALVWYAFTALRRVYGGPLWRTLVKGTAVGVVYCSVFLISIVALAIITVLVF